MLAQIIFFVFVSLALLALSVLKPEITAFYYSRIKKRGPLSLQEYRKYDAILTQKFPYYRKLGNKGKARFNTRLSRFLDAKVFVGMEGLMLTDEMRVLISASAIQLTFGLEEYMFDFFTTIRIYPKWFYSKLVRAEMIGGTTGAGVLLFSWEDFVKGYENPNDRYNLGLHEMAHALKLNLLKGDNFDERFSDYLDSWTDISRNEFLNMRLDQESFLREYGGRNEHEFFAVCVEHFFEVPFEFQQQLPDVFNHLCVLLNQDTRNITEDYKVNARFVEDVNKNHRLVPIPVHLRHNHRYTKWHNTYYLILYGIIAGFSAIFFFSSVTLISVREIFRVALIAAVLASVIQFRYFQKHKIFKPAEFILYLALGICPLTCGLFLTINYFFYTGHAEEKYPIKSTVRYEHEYVFLLENDRYFDYPRLRSMSLSGYKQFSEKSDTLKIVFAEGVLGYKVLARKELVSNTE